MALKLNRRNEETESKPTVIEETPDVVAEEPVFTKPERVKPTVTPTTPRTPKLSGHMQMVHMLAHNQPVKRLECYDVGLQPTEDAQEVHKANIVYVDGTMLTIDAQEFKQLRHLHLPFVGDTPEILL